MERGESRDTYTRRHTPPRIPILRMNEPNYSSCVYRLSLCLLDRLIPLQCPSRMIYRVWPHLFLSAVCAMQNQQISRQVTQAGSAKYSSKQGVQYECRECSPPPLLHHIGFTHTTLQTTCLPSRPRLTSPGRPRSAVGSIIVAS